MSITVGNTLKLFKIEQKEIQRKRQKEKEKEIIIRYYSENGDRIRFNVNVKFYYPQKSNLECLRC